MAIYVVAWEEGGGIQVCARNETDSEVYRAEGDGLDEGGCFGCLFDGCGI